jgi:hypothetical protein
MNPVIQNRWEVTEVAIVVVVFFFVIAIIVITTIVVVQDDDDDDNDDNDDDDDDDDDDSEVVEKWGAVSEKLCLNIQNIVRLCNHASFAFSVQHPT